MSKLNIHNDIKKGLYNLAINEIIDIKMKSSDMILKNACDEIINLSNEKGDIPLREILIDYLIIKTEEKY